MEGSRTPLTARLPARELYLLVLVGVVLFSYSMAFLARSAPWHVAVATLVQEGDSGRGAGVHAGPLSPGDVELEWLAAEQTRASAEAGARGPSLSAEQVSGPGEQPVRIEVVCSAETAAGALSGANRAAAQFADRRRQAVVVAFEGRWNAAEQALNEARQTLADWERPALASQGTPTLADPAAAAELEIAESPQVRVAARPNPAWDAADAQYANVLMQHQKLEANVTSEHPLFRASAQRVAELQQRRDETPRWLDAPAESVEGGPAVAVPARDVAAERAEAERRAAETARAREVCAAKEQVLLALQAEREGAFRASVKSIPATETRVERRSRVGVWQVVLSGVAAALGAWGALWLTRSGNARFHGAEELPSELGLTLLGTVRSGHASPGRAGWRAMRRAAVGVRWSAEGLLALGLCWVAVAAFQGQSLAEAFLANPLRRLLET